MTGGRSSNMPLRARLREATQFPEGALWPWFLFAAIFAAFAALTLVYELEMPSDAPFAWTDVNRDRLLAAALFVASLGIGGHAVLRKRGRGNSLLYRRLTAVVLALLTVTSGLAYFYGANGARSSYPHTHDSFHYLLGAKYFDELGYDLLYVCAVQASSPRDVPDKASARDLSSDETVTAADLRRGPNCRERFSGARWEQFRADLDVFAAIDRRIVRRVIGDRGYNGSPFHTFVAGHLANAFPLTYETLCLWPLLDAFSLCLMLASVCGAFGHRLGLLVAVFLFSQFVDRFMIIGGSFVRYQWLAVLGFALVWLKRERFALAGAAFAVAASLNVFPVLFCLPFVILTVLSLARTRTLSLQHKQLLGAALAVGIACGAVGAAHANGPENYVQFYEAMKVHNAAGRGPGFGVGLKYHFVSTSFHDAHSAKRRARELDERHVFIVACAVIVMGAVLLIVPRLSPVTASVLCGFAGLFCIFGPTGYYFALSPFLLLMWSRRDWDTGGLSMLALLFVLGIPPYVAILTGAHRFYVFNRVVSVCWTIYLLITLAFMYWSARRAERAS